MDSPSKSPDGTNSAIMAAKEPSNSYDTMGQRFVYILLLEPCYKWEECDSTHCVVQGVYSTRAAAVQAAGQVYPYSYCFPDRTFDELIAGECKDPGMHRDRRNEPPFTPPWTYSDDGLDLLLEVRNGSDSDRLYVKKFPIED